MVHSKDLPEWVSAHQIPGVWQLGRHDEADRPNLPMLKRNNGSPAPKYQRISVVDRDDIYGDRVKVAARIVRLSDGGEVCVSAAAQDQIEGKIIC